MNINVKYEREKGYEIFLMFCRIIFDAFDGNQIRIQGEKFSIKKNRYSQKACPRLRESQYRHAIDNPITL